MEFNKLPSNSEKILLKIEQAENPTQALTNLYRECLGKKRQILDGIIQELVKKKYIKVSWADNLPYLVTVNNSARTYEEQLSEYKSKQMKQEQQRIKNIIFISHRSSDEAITEMLIDFFVRTSIPREVIFCSSLPGNDVNEKISAEIKESLKNSAVNIAILSKDYYTSAYCLNEAGVLWYEDVPVIPIALPEINPSNMYGFLNDEYRIRRLNCDTDISQIYDIVSKAISAPQTTANIITDENKKLRKKYAEYIKTRELSKPSKLKTNTISISKITTDDEKIVLHYIFENKIRKVSKSNIKKWLSENEIYGINIDNAFDLLSLFDDVTVTDDVLEFEIGEFRKHHENDYPEMPELQNCVLKHKKLAVNTFKMLWNSNKIDSLIKLFIAYIVDEQMPSFEHRKMAKTQIDSIKKWEADNSLYSDLSNSYGKCLEFFIQNDLVYASSWTSCDNPREYSLCTSLKEYLFNCPSMIANELRSIKESYYLDLVF